MNHLKYIRNKIWTLLVKCTYGTYLYPKIYKSYWRYYFINNVKSVNKEINYFSAIPNPGAGIGHQMANWIAGYWYAKKFKLRFAHSEFINSEWDLFLGFGEDEVSVSKLVNLYGYKKINLPLFDEKNEKEVSMVDNIIKSYRNERIVFIAEQDQFYKDQYGVMNDMKYKFFHAESRKNDKLMYVKSNFNIAVHIRRGDIVIDNKIKNNNLAMRFQDESYFVNILKNVLNDVNDNRPKFIYLFSQGSLDDFSKFNSFENVKFCINMDEKESFLHMVYADLLITSKSSFSYKPALINSGIKICPEDFWHSYPNEENWILANSKGEYKKKSI